MSKYKKFIPIIPILILLTLLFLGWKKSIQVSDFRDYYRASKLFIEKKDIYQVEEAKNLQKNFQHSDLFNPEILEKLMNLKGNVASYIYPPTFAVLISPLTLLEYESAARLFFLINFFCLLGSLYLFSQLGFSSRFSLLLLFTLLISFRFLENHVTNNQVAFILILLCTLCVYTKNDVLSGFLFSLAVIIKITPAILVIYFLYTKRWKVFLYAFIFFLLLASLPILVGGYDYGITQWKNFYELVIQSAMKSPLFRAWKNNQSLVATLSKYFLMGADPENQYKYGLPVVVLDPVLVKQIFYSLTILLFIPLFMKMKKGIGNLQLFSALLVLSVVLSGVSWVHSFSILLFPIFFLVQKIGEYPEYKYARYSFVFFSGIIVLSNKSIVSGPIESTLLMFSILLYASIGLYALILYYPEDEF